MHQSRAVAAYIARSKDYSKQQRKAVLAMARQYNARLSQRALLSKSENENDRWVMTDAGKRYYESVLDIAGMGVMGYVTVPSIKVRLPIHHGTDEGILRIATGHIAGGSLPVGGESTHAVVSGHAGLPGVKLFTGLDKLKKGDTRQARPGSIQVQLIRDGEVCDTATLAAGNNWKHSWSGLDASHDWLVREKSVPEGYVVAVERDSTDVTITNTATRQAGTGLNVMVVAGLMVAVASAALVTLAVVRTCRNRN
ncbi:sortase [Bifidobacterium dentium]|uniref:sortase n=1 Tax=Bifidobacterium dentium TaxID=1689 RepID=UPI003D162837